MNIHEFGQEHTVTISLQEIMLMCDKVTFKNSIDRTLLFQK